MESAEQQSIDLSVARAEDMADVFSLRLQARKTDPAYFPTSYEEERARPLADKQRWFNNPKQLVVVARIKDHPAGMMCAREKEPGTWYLHGVYVAPEFRGKHIADKLMKFIVTAIRNSPDSKLITFQVEANNTPAIELYKKYGFEIVGEDQAVHGDGQVHQKLDMQQAIGKILV